MPDAPHGPSAEERLERLLDLQTLLARVARDIGPALELDAVLKTVLEAMRSLVEFRGGTVQLVDEGGVYVAAADRAVSDDVLAARVPVGTGLSGRVVAEGITVYSPDIRADERVDPQLRRSGTNAPSRSYLAVPLVVLGAVIGALQVDSNEVDAFDADDAAVLEGLAIQVSGAIESARRRADLVELERMKADFIARISHELRTPLTVMGGFTDTLLRHGDRLSASETHEVLTRVKTSVSRLSALIEEILTVSSLDAGVSRVRPVEVDVAELLREVAHLSVDESRVSVEAVELATVVTDAVMIRHLVNQLVDNALKYGGDAVLSAGWDDGAPCIVVRDHGPGVPAADRDRVFERFFRGNHTGAGMGLGLPVVRQLAASLEAGVVVDDAPGGGARFTVRFRAMRMTKNMDRWLGDGGMPIIEAIGGAFDAYDGDAGWATCAWTPTPLACNPHGYVQAGVHDIVLDAAMNFAINATLDGRDRTRSTIDLQASYLRSADLGGSFVVRGTVARITRQVAFAEAACTDADGRLVSRATGTFLLHREAEQEGRS